MTANAETGLAATAMTYDLANKLLTINAGGGASGAAFTFDALGRFRTRVVDGVTDTYSYDVAKPRMRPVVVATWADSGSSAGGRSTGLEDSSPIRQLSGLTGAR